MRDETLITRGYIKCVGCHCWVTSGTICSIGGASSPLVHKNPAKEKFRCYYRQSAWTMWQRTTNHCFSPSSIWRYSETLSRTSREALGCGHLRGKLTRTVFGRLFGTKEFCRTMTQAIQDQWTRRRSLATSECAQPELSYRLYLA